MKNYSNGFSNNIGLFKLAENSQVQRNFVWFILLVAIVATLGAIPASILAIVFTVVEPNEVLGHMINLVGGFGLVALLVFAIVKFREKRQVSDLGFTRMNWIKNYFKGFLYGLAMLGLCSTMMWALGGLKIVAHTENVGLNMLPSILIVLFGWIVQGGTEEILYRGWMLPLLGRKYNVPFAIVVSSLGFMLLHMGNDGMTIMPIINLLLFGVFAALYVVKEKNLWSICGWHSAWNWMQGNFIGVEVSGSNVPGGSIIKMTAQGNPLISGGPFGIEGSIVCTIVLTICSVYLIHTQMQKTESIELTLDY